MKILSISDTHSKHRSIKIEDADVIVCSGDITFRGELDILADFVNWMKNLPIKHKICVFGNHELDFEGNGFKRPYALSALQNAGIIYLEDSGVEIDGVKFWGSPITPYFHGWEFNRHRGEEIKKHWDQIPNDTNVLITHGPPYGILDTVMNIPSNSGRDLHQGCKDLTNKISDLTNLKAHIFGHIHCSYGIRKIHDTYFVNAAICNESYIPDNPPILIEI